MSASQPAIQEMRLTQPQGYVPVLFGVFMLLLPLGLDSYFINLAIMVLLSAALGSAWNLIGGFGGQFSLGHAAYFGLGAYATILMDTNFGISPWIGMFVGMGLSLILALTIGRICFHLRGHYFAICTIVICELFRLVCQSWRSLTEGGVGVSVPFRGEAPAYFQFLDKKPYYYILLLLLASIMFTSYKVSRAKIGFYLRAIGQNQDAAEVVGVNTATVKCKTLAMSAIFTSMCGTFWTQYMYFVDPDICFGLPVSIEIACIAVVGGMGTVWGPFVGAVLLRPLIEITLVTLGGYYAGVHLVVYSVVLIFVVTQQPAGLIGLTERLYQSLLRRLPGLWEKNPTSDLA